MRSVLRSFIILLGSIGFLCAEPSIPLAIEERLIKANNLEHGAQAQELGAICDLLVSKHNFSGKEANIVNLRVQQMESHIAAGRIAQAYKTAVVVFESQHDQNRTSDSFRLASGDSRRIWKSMLGLPGELDSSLTRFDPDYDRLAPAALVKFGPKVATFFASAVLGEKIEALPGIAILPVESRLSAVTALRPFANLVELKDPRLLLESSIAFKDLLLDLSLVEERQNQTAKSSPKVARWMTARQEFRNRYAQGKLTTDDELHTILVGAPGQLRQGMSLSVSEVQQILPEKSLLVDYLFVPREGSKTGGTYYGVLCGKTHLTGPVFLGEAEQINAAVETFTGAVSNWLESDVSGQVAHSASISRNASGLHDLLVAPILKLAPEDTQNLILSCDGAIHLVPFALLPDSSGKFLVERYHVQHVDSLRGLAKGVEAPKLAPKGQQLFVGDPTYSIAGSGVNAGQESESRTASRLIASTRQRDSRQADTGAFPPLPGTAKEIEAIFQALPSTSAGKVVRMEKAAATEAAVCKEMQRANIIHLATHGFTMAQGGEVFPSEKNPMNLAGLAFAGANRAFASWQMNGVSMNPNDGILLAGEVALLDLKDTAQVVLSACDTGQGSIVANNGVIGLRRAFVIAGVPQIIVTLWPVLDEVPEPLMKEYYRQVFDGKIGAESWGKCLGSEIARLRTAGRDPGFIVACLGPFVMVSNQFSTTATGPPDPQGVLRLVLNGVRGNTTDNMLGDPAITTHFTPAFLLRIKSTTNGKAGFVEKMLPDNLEFVSAKVEGDEAYLEMRGEYGAAVTYVLVLREGRWLIDDVL